MAANIHTTSAMQCSHASVGLAQARPNKYSYPQMASNKCKLLPSGDLVMYYLGPLSSLCLPR